ncbi:MAG: hypothetical protein DELT_00591 [Desulfovibrio sp.]
MSSEIQYQICTSDVFYKELVSWGYPLFVRLADFAQITGHGRSTAHLWIKENRFPLPIYNTAEGIRVKLSDVAVYMCKDPRYDASTRPTRRTGRPRSVDSARSIREENAARRAEAKRAIFQKSLELA